MTNTDKFIFALMIVHIWKRIWIMEFFGTPVISSYGDVSLHKQSYRESFMSLVENRFGGNVCIYWMNLRSSYHLS